MGSKGPRSSLSLGTILTLCLTLIVTVGCVYVFRKIQSQNPDASMGAQKVIGLIDSALQGATPSPASPQPTVRTVKVTLAPQPQATPLPSFAPNTIPTAAPASGRQYAFSVTVGGMICFHSDITDSVYDADAKTFDYSAIGAALRSKVYADLNLASLPQVINTEDLKYADILAPAAIAESIRGMGFSHVLLSTEHILDQGVDGAMNTVTALKAQKLTPVGVNAGYGTQNALITINGAKVALLAYTDVLTAKGQNELAKEPYLLRMYNQDIAREDIRNALAQGAECVIVCMYWGKADTASPTNAQKNIARALAEMGADVILGFRPTRVLPMEVLGTVAENGKYHETLVAYSMGTLLTESREGNDISGILLHISVSVNERGEVSFSSLEYTPTYVWRQSVNGKMLFRIVSSADAPPEGMNADQQRYLQNALTRVQKALQTSPVALRTE